MGRVFHKQGGAPPTTILVGYTPLNLPPNVQVVTKVLDPVVLKAMELGGIAIKWEDATPDEIASSAYTLHYYRQPDGRFWGVIHAEKPSSVTENLGGTRMHDNE